LISYVDDSQDPSSKALYVGPEIETVLGYTVEEWLSTPGLFDGAITRTTASGCSQRERMRIRAAVRSAASSASAPSPGTSSGWRTIRARPYTRVAGSITRHGRYDRQHVEASAHERERLSWAHFGAATRDLARQVADDGYAPDLILSIARGGLLVGAALGYALDVKNTWTMNVEFYTGIDERLDVPMILPPVPELVELESARMLIADDVADTGETLRLVKEFCEGKVAEVRCAVLYQKSRSLVACEYVWKRTDLWIDFPWSAHAPVASASAG
jgi:hypoxanthine phosphoribosyltransferase